MKKIFILLFLFQLNINIFGQITGKYQLIQSNDWIYDAMNYLSYETGITSLINTAPMSIEELKYYLKQIDENSLSDNGKELYELVVKKLIINKPLLKIGALDFTVNPILSPELYYKTNDKLKWSYVNNYSGNCYYDYAKKEYFESSSITASNYYFNELTNQFISLPIYLSVSDYIMMEIDPFITKSVYSMSLNNNKFNLPLGEVDFETYFPEIAYFSTGYLFNNFGIAFQVGKQGFEYGRSLTGSIIYNNTFQTDAYFNFEIYSEYLKYNLLVTEIDYQRFMYFHCFSFNPYWKKLKIGFVEGMLVDSVFELRYLNPIMLMHSYGFWNYSLPDNEKSYYDAHRCAYLGLTLDFVPIKNLRIYALYAQNELQAKDELGSPYSNSLPNGLGIQTGIEYNFNKLKIGNLIFNGEFIYTSPYLYLKQGMEWSLVSKKMIFVGMKDIPIYSWIGSPFGPDSIGGKLNIKYSNFNNFTINLSYLFLAHGEINTSVFDSKFNGYYAYYPSVLRLLGLLNDNESEILARNMKITGILQYSNEIELFVEYKFNNNFSINGDLIYSFIYNINNNPDTFENGFQINFGGKVKLF